MVYLHLIDIVHSVHLAYLRLLLKNLLSNLILVSQIDAHHLMRTFEFFDLLSEFLHCRRSKMELFEFEKQNNLYKCFNQMSFNERLGNVEF